MAVACGAHALHDGYTDLLYVLLPLWQTQFGLGYAEVGVLRALYAGSMAGFQLPAGALADRLGGPLVLALGTALAVNGFHHFGINLSGSSLWIPTFVISIVFIPYLARPLRGQILSLRQSEFIDAAISQGANPMRVMFSELLPNIASTVLVLFTLIVASTILTEAALSFLGAGVQAPNPSWGTLIAAGQNTIQTAPWLGIAPGIAIVLTVLALNVFGDALRDALDPRAKVRIEH